MHFVQSPEQCSEKFWKNMHLVKRKGLLQLKQSKRKDAKNENSKEKNDLLTT